MSDKPERDRGLTLLGWLAVHNAQRSCVLETFVEYVPDPGKVYGGPVLTVRCLKDNNEFTEQIYNVNDSVPDDMRPQPANAPRWNCVTYPGEGMHYVPDVSGNCEWCGMTGPDIADERAIRDGNRGL